MSGTNEASVSSERLRPSAQADDRAAPQAPPGRPDVSIIVVNYRTRELTLECLRSIVRESRQASYEILLVDNNSSDGTIEAVAREMPEARLFPLKTNVGFAQGNNVAAKEAKGKYLLLLNPDTVVLNGAIDRLMGFAAERPEAKIWGGQSLLGDHSLDYGSCWRRMTLWSVFCHTFGLSAAWPNSSLLNPEAYGGWNRSSVREVDIICGCFLLISKEFWDELGGFDARFFMYGEEADLCLRAARLGARPAFTPTATIIHYGGASEQVETEKLVRILGAKAELIKRHWSPASRNLGLFLFSLWPLMVATAYGLAGRLAHNDRRRARAETLWQVWKRRADWRSGLPA